MGQMFPHVAAELRQQKGMKTNTQNWKLRDLDSIPVLTLPYKKLVK